MTVGALQRKEPREEVLRHTGRRERNTIEEARQRAILNGNHARDNKTAR